MDKFPAFQRNFPRVTDKVEDGRHIEETPREVEHQLINIGRWALESVKVTGYFPFYIAEVPETSSNGTPTQVLKQIQLRRLSGFSVYLGILHLIGGSFIAYGFCYAYQTTTLIAAANKTSSQNSFSDEEDNFISTYNAMAMLLFCAILRTIYIISPQKTFCFWKHFVSLFKGFYDLDILVGNPHFDQIKSKVKRFSAGFLILTLVQTGVMFAYIQRIYNNSTYGRGKYLHDDQSLIVRSLTACIVIFIHLYVGFFIWLGFLIQIYTTCFKAIGGAVMDEISRLSVAADKEKISWKGAVWSNRNKGETNNFTSNNHDYRGERLSRLLSLFEQVCESTEVFNQFYTLPITIDVFICITNAFASVYAINKVMYEYGIGVDGDSHWWDKTVDLFYRIPSHCAIVCRVVYLALAGNNLTQESLRVIQQLQLFTTRCRSVLTDFTLLSQIQMLVTRVSANPPGISPSGFFTLNKAFLLSLLSVLATYFFILTEFREKNEGWNSIRKLNFSCGI